MKTTPHGQQGSLVQDLLGVLQVEIVSSLDPVNELYIIMAGNVEVTGAAGLAGKLSAGSMHTGHVVPFKRPANT
jgi:hypothetical protein